MVPDGSRFSTRFLWAEVNIIFQKTYSELVQIKSGQKRFQKNLTLKEQYFNTIKDDLDKGCIITNPLSHTQNGTVWE